jgi:hypothetical protein
MICPTCHRPRAQRPDLDRYEIERVADEEQPREARLCWADERCGGVA